MTVPSPPTSDPTPRASEDVPALPRRRRRRAWTWAAVALFVVAAVLRLGLIDRQGLWADEVFSLSMATGHSIEHPAASADPAQGDYVEVREPTTVAHYAAYAKHDSPPAGPARVIRAVRLSDTSPPLYYLVLHYWTRLFGTGDRALRMLSVVCSLAAFPFIWSAARMAGGRAAAVVAGLLWALLPLSLYNAVEGRMYGLLWLAAAANVWAALRLQRSPGLKAGAYSERTSRATAWVALGVWIVSSVVGLHTHYFFLFAWLPTCVWLVLYPGRVRRTTAVAAALVAGLAALPWYATVPSQLAAWRVTGGWLEWRPGHYHPLWFHLRLPYHFFAVSGPWGVRGRIDEIVAAVYVLLAAVVLWRCRRAAFAPRWLLGWFIVAGTVGGLVAFDVWRGTYAGAIERYAAPGLAGGVLLAALALASLPRYWRLALLAPILLACLIATRRMYLNDSRIGQKIREIATVLATDAKPSDVVIVHSIPSGVSGLARYMEPRVTRTGGGGPGFASWVGQLKQRTVETDMPALVRGRRRVFLVRFHEVAAPMPQKDWLEDNATRTRYLKNFGHVVVLAYEPKTGGVFP